MRRRIITIASAALLALAAAAPASAHPVDPPGNDRGVVTAAGGQTPAHSLGLACAAERSPAIVVLTQLECTIGWGR